MAGASLAVQVEKEPPHRVGRKAAIAEQVVPVAITPLGRVLPERGEQIAGVIHRNADRFEVLAKPIRRFVARRRRRGARQRRIDGVEAGDLLVGVQVGMIGDVVGRPDNRIE